MEQKDISKLVIDDTVYETILSAKFRKRKRYQPVDHRRITAFIPGLIEKVHVTKGEKVMEGDKLLILEAMKMKNDLNSPVNGIVKEVLVKEGVKVAKGELLIIIE